MKYKEYFSDLYKKLFHSRDVCKKNDVLYLQTTKNVCYHEKEIRNFHQVCEVISGEMQVPLGQEIY